MPKGDGPGSRATQFRPGQSGNPGGNPRTKERMERVARELDFLLQENAVREAFTLHVGVLKIARKQQDAGIPPDAWMRGWQQSADFVTDRVLGKPKQQTEISSEGAMGFVILGVAEAASGAEWKKLHAPQTAD